MKVTYNEIAELRGKLRKHGAKFEQKRVFENGRISWKDIKVIFKKNNAPGLKVLGPLERFCEIMGISWELV